ncbi:hypothetical protein ACF1BE_16570 [Streptomyces sp. NPDC014991]|uniref:hypothetical protein n=1 Tax=Streptomyces sp. NPDC014991 TaxID=3364935 RepID=UPI0036F9D9D8
MRLRTSLSLCLATGAATATVVVPVSPEPAFADSAPSCAGADTRAFPLATRIRGGPASYEAGGGYGTWYIDLTNTTRRACARIHPVVVLADDRRALRPEQPQLDFYEGSRVRPVTFESTDAHELVGVLDGAGFDGFTVPPGGTVSVRVRLALTSDAQAGRVTANAAAVQRRGQDGDWVGESNTYRFSIGGDEEDTGEATPTPSGSAPASPTDTATPPSSPPSAQQTQAAEEAEETQEAQETPETQETQEAQEAEEAEEPQDEEAEEAEAAHVAQVAGGAQEAGERARELARTGRKPARGLLVAVAALLGVGAAAFLLVRGRRR